MKFSTLSSFALASTLVAASPLPKVEFVTVTQYTTIQVDQAEYAAATERNAAGPEVSTQARAANSPPSNSAPKANELAAPAPQAEESVETPAAKPAAYAAPSRTTISSTAAAETPANETPEEEIETPQTETPKTETPETETPKTETPETETSKTETPETENADKDTNPTKSSNSPSGSTFSGDGTFYEPDVGACGQRNSGDELVVAIPKEIYDPYTPNYNPNKNTLCGRKINAHYEGKSVQVTVVDRCAGCRTAHDLDLSPEAFKHIADPDLGRIKLTWEWAD